MNKYFKTNKPGLSWLQHHHCHLQGCSVVQSREWSCNEQTDYCWFLVQRQRGLYILSSQRAGDMFLLQGQHDKCQQIFPCFIPSSCLKDNCKQGFSLQQHKYTQHPRHFPSKVVLRETAVATSLFIHSSGFPRAHCSPVENIWTQFLIWLCA